MLLRQGALQSLSVPSKVPSSACCTKPPPPAVGESDTGSCGREHLEANKECLMLQERREIAWVSCHAGDANTKQALPGEG